MRYTFLILVGLLLVAFQFSVNAVQYVPGVHPGDWARYRIRGDLSENVVMSNLTVTQVSGTNITVISTDVYVTGNVSSHTLWVDLSTGQNNTVQFGFPAFFFIILPGRSVGEGIYGVQSLIIQNSLDRTYFQNTRRTNFANITRLGSGSTSYYWDAQTGILAEILQLHQNQTVAIHAFLVATSLWSPQVPFSRILEALVVGLLVATTAILAYVRWTRNRNRKKSRKRS